MPSRHGLHCNCAVCEEVRELDPLRGPETALVIGLGDPLYDELRSLETKDEDEEE